MAETLVDPSSFPTQKTSVVSSRMLAVEQAEMTAIAGKIYDYLTEIELLAYRMRLRAPSYSSSHKEIITFLSDWVRFRSDHADLVRALSLGDSPVGV